MITPSQANFWWSLRLIQREVVNNQCKVLCVQSCQQLVNSGVVNTKVHWGYFARRGLWQGIARIYLQPKDNTWFRYLLFYFGQNLLQYQSEQSDNVALPYLVRFPNPLAFGLPKVRRGPCLYHTHLVRFPIPLLTVGEHTLVHRGDVNAPKTHWATLREVNMCIVLHWLASACANCAMRAKVSRFLCNGLVDLCNVRCALEERFRIARKWSISCPAARDILQLLSHNHQHTMAAKAVKGTSGQSWIMIIMDRPLHMIHQN